MKTTSRKISSWLMAAALILSGSVFQDMSAQNHRTYHSSTEQSRPQKPTGTEITTARETDPATTATTTARETASRETDPATTATTTVRATGLVTDQEEACLAPGQADISVLTVPTNGRIRHTGVLPDISDIGVRCHLRRHDPYITARHTWLRRSPPYSD